MAEVVRDEGRFPSRTEEAPGAGTLLTPSDAVYGVTKEQTPGSPRWGWNGPLSLLVATFLFKSRSALGPRRSRSRGFVRWLKLEVQLKENFTPKGCLEGGEGFVLMG